MTITVHPTLYQEFIEKCRYLNITEPNYLIAAMMRDFLIECKMTNNSPKILTDSTLVEKKIHQTINQHTIN